MEAQKAAKTERMKEMDGDKQRLREQMKTTFYACYMYNEIFFILDRTIM